MDVPDHTHEGLVITYAERVCFHAFHLHLLFRVEALVARVSRAWGDELRCHELARAVQRVLGEDVGVVDGKCGPVEHSWLACAGGVILDPYVPGRLPAVQIVDSIVGTLYRHGAPRDDIRHETIDRLVLEMRGA